MKVVVDVPAVGVMAPQLRLGGVLSTIALVELEDAPALLLAASVADAPRIENAIVPLPVQPEIVTVLEVVPEPETKALQPLVAVPLNEMRAGVSAMVVAPE